MFFKGQLSLPQILVSNYIRPTPSMIANTQLLSKINSYVEKHKHKKHYIDEGVNIKNK